MLTSSGGGQLRAGRYTVHHIVEKAHHPLFLRQGPPGGSPNGTSANRTTAKFANENSSVRELNLPQLLADESQSRLLLREEEMKERYLVCCVCQNAASPGASEESDQQRSSAAAWNRHVSFLEEVQRECLTSIDEPEARRSMCNEFAREMKVRAAGIAPMKRFLHKFLLRQRACLAIRDKKMLDVVCSESSERSGILQEASDWFIASSCKYFYLTEALNRRQLIMYAMLFFYGAARIQVQIEERIALFEVKFACPQASAPKMCGRVARHSLFHSLSLHENHWRADLLQAYQLVCSGYEAFKSSFELEIREEPRGRQDVEECWASEFAATLRLKRQIVSYYLRREVEHNEVAGRMAIERHAQESFPKMSIVAGE